MLHMIELHYTQDQREQALNYFQKHGMTNYEGDVFVQELWVATEDRIAYAVVESNDPKEVEKACSPLTQFGNVTSRAIISADQL